MLIANARMYSVNASVAASWRELLGWVIRRSCVACEVIDYPPPAPLPALWARADMGCVFMCGFPLALAQPAPRILAAPIPSPARYGGRPVYATDIVVRADSPWRNLDDVFGRRFAFTTEDSQSGYQAPRRLLAPFARGRGGALFADTVGPLVTPRRVVEAILGGEADAGPLDSYFHDLLRLHEPGIAAQLRVLVSTPMTVIPALVAAPSVAEADARHLSDALLAVGDAPELATLRAELLLQGFASAARTSYLSLVDDARAADAAGYPRIA